MPFLIPEEFVYSKPDLERTWTLSESLAYTRWLATEHYENFHVVSFLLPRNLHEDFYNVYAFCRWADDLADEIESTEESLRLLAWWREQLDRMYDGEAEHPVFVALAATVHRLDIPKEPFSDLISAFVQDQTVLRYSNWPELYGYCRYSANPVGLLVLYLCGYRDEERQRLSDATCTALQMANHWQDIGVDAKKGRIYVPQDVMAKHGCSDEGILSGREDAAFISTMREIVDHARVLFLAGLPLSRMVNRRLAVDLDLFSLGGMRVLTKIEQQGYRVLTRRPVIGKLERVRLLLQTLGRVAITPRL